MSTKRALTFFDGDWHEGNPKLIGPMTHAMWLSSIVFDGARAFEGTAPDLDLHCARTVRSAEALGMQPTKQADEILGLAKEGIAKLGAEGALYVRPMFYADTGFVDLDPDSTCFALSVYDSPLPGEQGFSVVMSDHRRPAPDTAPTQAKASCLYPQAGLALMAAKKRGFDNAVMCDQLGNVAEFATANIMIAKDGAVHTPVPNGTFLNGITRQRVIQLLRDDGIEVIERTLRPHEVLDADEIFSTGNYGKVMPVRKIEDRDLQPGPCYHRARKLYWDYAHATA